MNDKTWCMLATNPERDKSKFGVFEMPNGALVGVDGFRVHFNIDPDRNSYDLNDAPSHVVKFYIGEVVPIVLSGRKECWGYYELLEKLLAAEDNEFMTRINGIPFMLNAAYVLDALVGLDEDSDVNVYADGPEKFVILQSDRRIAAIMPMQKQ